VNKKLVIYLLSKKEGLWFLRMHSSSPIVCGLAQMAVVATTQHQERENNGNVYLERLNLKRLMGSHSDESEKNDDDDLEWKPNVASDEDGDGEGNDNDGENEVLTEAQSGVKRKQVQQYVWIKEIRLKIVKWMVEQIVCQSSAQIPNAFLCYSIQFQHNESFPYLEEYSKYFGSYEER
jgi:hypothetical protein